jgi:hypothetical protein
VTIAASAVAQPELTSREALGVTRQAVHKKHAKRLKALGVEARKR